MITTKYEIEVTDVTGQFEMKAQDIEAVLREHVTINFYVTVHKKQE